ncbi:MAG: hypothetical protein LBT30_07185 [Clostridiales bacterium]|jgi:hypothetical protein|nr:hypothetical protein [Clostridiales bacterium]
MAEKDRNKEAMEFLQYVNKKNYDVKTIMLSTPYRCSVPIDFSFNKKLTEPIFFNNFYVESDDSKKIKEDFYKNIFDASSKNIYFIRGYSGCGKTIYLNSLLYDIKQRNDKIGYYIKKFDLSEAKGTMCFFRVPIYNEITLESTALKQFNALLINSISDFLMNIVAKLELFKAFCEFWSSIIQHESYAPLKNVIEAYYAGYIDEPEMINRLRQFIEPYYQNTSELLKINMLLAYSAAKHQYTHYRGDIKGIKIIFAFDNIEHYIGSDVIYDENIETIMDIIIEFATTEKDHFNLYEIKYKKKELTFFESFQFIVAMRDTTEKMLTKHEHDFSINDITVDLTGVYDADKIISARRTFFKDNDNIKKQEKKLAMLEALLRDENTLEKGFSDRIRKMYNYNMRRITDYFLDAINDEAVQQYELLQRRHFPDIRSSKFVTRRMILRKMFDQINVKAYFKSLNLVTKDGNNGVSYVRQILTFLHNENPNNSRKGEYIYFRDFVSNQLGVSSCVALSDEQKNRINKLAEIICFLQQDSKIYNWSQLVVVKFNQKQFDASRLAEKLKNAAEGVSTEDCLAENFGIKITEAGRFFAFMLNDFEYFACRYCENSQPLFYDYNSQQGNPKECIRIIKTTSDKAITCIGATFVFDNIYCNKSFSKLFGPNSCLYPNDDGESQTHVQRIADNHLSYLLTYKIYIENNYSSLGLKRSDADIIQKATIEAAKAYIKKLHEFTSKKDTNGFYYLSGKATTEGDDKYYKRHLERWGLPEELLVKNKNDKKGSTTDDNI